jgi:RNA polymerase sigma-70 factor (ECF subfamily)
LNAGAAGGVIAVEPGGIDPPGHGAGELTHVDRDLVVAAQAGDRDAFAVLARTQVDRLYALANRILRDTGLAEDAAQQALVAIWRELPTLRNPDRFASWATRILVNECNSEARRRSRYAAELRVITTDPPAGGDAVLAFVDRDELERGFRRLPPEQRAVLVLHHYLGLEPAEIAIELGIPPGTVRSRLHYAHRAMRAVLEADARPSRASGGAGR